MLSHLWKKNLTLPDASQALPGRSTPLEAPGRHVITGKPLAPPYPQDTEQALFGMGCFWGAERKFWSLPGVYVTAVGYAGGFTRHPTYREVCSGLTGHAEVVRVVFYPTELSYAALLRVFWESHDPTQGMRQGNDVGTQYRSLILTFSEQQRLAAETSRDDYQRALRDAALGTISTEISDAPEFYFAEHEHQQYLAKNPDGYCGLGGTGILCPQPRS